VLTADLDPVVRNHSRFQSVTTKGFDKSIVGAVGDLDREAVRPTLSGENRALVADKDLAVVDDGDARTEAFRFLHVVGGIDHGGAVAVEIGQAVEDEVAGLGIDTHGGLVEEQDVRRAENRHRQVQASFHTP